MLHTPRFYLYEIWKRQNYRDRTDQWSTWAGSGGGEGLPRVMKEFLGWWKRFVLIVVVVSCQYAFFRIHRMVYLKRANCIAQKLYLQQRALYITNHSKTQWLEKDPLLSRPCGLAVWWWTVDLAGHRCGSFSCWKFGLNEFLILLEPSEWPGHVVFMLIIETQQSNYRSSNYRRVFQVIGFYSTY